MLLKSKILTITVSVLAVLTTTGVGALARDAVSNGDKPDVLSPLSAVPTMQVRVHKVGNVALTVTNYGIFGNQGDPSIRDPETNQPAPSCQYPYGSGLEYLFQGALWVGAIVGSDTLVSTGHDGWQNVYEMYADPAPQGNIIKRSTRPSDPAYSPNAISEADYIATYYDTLTDPNYVRPNPDDGRPHIPLGLKIVQRSYSWSSAEFEDFIIFRYSLTNIGSNNLQDVFVGLLYDCDIAHVSSSMGFTDDISGSYSIPDSTTGDSVLVGWSADNNGDPINYQTEWNFKSPRAVFGASLIDFPLKPVENFNWWVSNGDSPGAFDWGPRLAVNDRVFGTGGLGTPAGDRNKYYIMSRPERDYDQLWSAINKSSEGWLPPNPTVGADLADGYDTRFLSSFGPLDLAPGDSAEFAFVVAMGDNFHRNPDDFKNNFVAGNPQQFYNTFDFSDLATNVLDARRLYKSLFPLAGDANGDERVDLSDVVYLVSYIFAGGPAPTPLRAGDVNGDCRINLTDAVYLIAYIFNSGAPPVRGCVE